MKLLSSAGLCLLLATGAAAEKLEPAAEFVHEDAAGKLAMVGDVAVVLSGDDPFLCRLAEDVVAISLMEEGVRIVYPDQAYLGKPRADEGRTPVGVAKAVGANVLVTGTMLTDGGECAGCGAGQHQCPGRCRSTKVALASLSVVDLPLDKTLVWAMYEPETPASVTAVARAFAAKFLADLK